MKPFVDLSAFALKSEHARFLQDFIVWPKCLETETTKTETSRDRIGQTERAQTEMAQIESTRPKSRGPTTTTKPSPAAPN